MHSATLLLALATLTAPIRAHIALWDEGMFGYDPNDPNQWEPVLPLMHLPFDQWWFHGYINKPPAEGKFMTLPSGGAYHGQVACNKALTRYGQNDYQQTGEYACDGDGPQGGIGAMHTADQWASQNPTDLKGCAIAIAYESDEHKVQPEDFAVISVNHECVWKKNVDFQIPDNLPACPPEGCICLWEWIHAIDAGSQQLFHLAYRCKIDGATGTTPLPRSRIANKCPVDKTNCTVGAKTPHYWYQAERNNNPQGEYDPPLFNDDYGFSNGAQMDLFATAGDSPDTPDTPDTPDSPDQPNSPETSETPEVSESPNPTSSAAPTSLTNQQAIADPTASSAPPPADSGSSTDGESCARRKRALDYSDPAKLARPRIRQLKRSRRTTDKRSAAVRKSIMDHGISTDRFGKAAREWEEEQMIKRLVGI